PGSDSTLWVVAERTAGPNPTSAIRAAAPVASAAAAKATTEAVVSRRPTAALPRHDPDQAAGLDQRRPADLPMLRRREHAGLAVARGEGRRLGRLLDERGDRPVLRGARAGPERVRARVGVGGVRAGERLDERRLNAQAL